MKKAVICVETSEIFATATEAAKAFNCTVANICSTCNGKQKTAKGKHFRYLGENELPTETEVVVSKPCYVKAKGKRSNGNAHAVFCIDDGTVYISCSDAAEANEVAQSTMSYICNRKGSISNGKRFCYIKDLPFYLDEISNAVGKSADYDRLVAKEKKRNQLRESIDEIRHSILETKIEIENQQCVLKSLEEALRKATEEFMNL